MSQLLEDLSSEVQQKITTLENDLQKLTRLRNAMQKCESGNDFYNLAMDVESCKSFDISTIFRLYFEAAKLNHEGASKKVFKFLQSYYSYKTTKILSELVNQNNPYAMEHLAKLYLSKYNCNHIEEISKAIDLLNKSIALGCVSASKTLDEVFCGCYPNAKLYVKPEKAIAYYEQGNAISSSLLNELGVMYNHGWYGIIKSNDNDKIALDLYNISASLGCEKALYNMALHYQSENLLALELFSLYKYQLLSGLGDYYLNNKSNYNYLSELYVFYATTGECMKNLEQQIQENEEHIKELETDHVIFMQQFE